LATFLHGYIGDMIRDEEGPMGIIASDVVNRIPTALKELQDTYREGRSCPQCL
jgi:NAD(P)H-hydrate repair Nnr-like enzyme with NAD(P)H-hydrate dehydratase domain